MPAAHAALSEGPHHCGGGGGGGAPYFGRLAWEARLAPILFFPATSLLHWAPAMGWLSFRAGLMACLTLQVRRTASQRGVEGWPMRKMRAPPRPAPPATTTAATAARRGRAHHPPLCVPCWLLSRSSSCHESISPLPQPPRSRSAQTQSGWPPQWRRCPMLSPRPTLPCSTKQPTGRWTCCVMAAASRRVQQPLDPIVLPPTRQPASRRITPCPFPVHPPPVHPSPTAGGARRWHPARHAGRPGRRCCHSRCRAAASHGRLACQALPARAGSMRLHGSQAHGGLLMACRQEACRHCKADLNEVQADQRTTPAPAHRRTGWWRPLEEGSTAGPTLLPMLRARAWRPRKSTCLPATWPAP